MHALRSILPLMILLPGLAATALAQPVTSPLGALGRANEAAGAASGQPFTAPAPSDSAQLSAPSRSLVAPLPDDNEDFEGDPPNMSYDPEGRRDPFRALTGEAADTEARKQFEGTLKGRLLSEVKLTSILKHPQGNIATLEGGPKKEGYFARAGADLWDAKVVSVDADNLVIVVRQEVDDPRAIKKWRDLVIPLWSEEEKKADTGTGP